MPLRRWSMALLAILSTAAPAGAQESRRIVTPSGEIRIPTQQELEREVFSSPCGNLSAIDDVVDGEMDRTGREIDREMDRLVMRGTCRACRGC